MNRLKITCVCMLFFACCEGQKSKPRETDPTCNRTVYGTSEYIEFLPEYICIPKGFIFDDYIRLSDLDNDKKNDFIALKYNKRQDDQVDGDSTYWRFYFRSRNDTLYRLQKTLRNIVPPFIVDISWEYLASHEIAGRLYNDYPRRLSHSQSFKVSADTIWLSYKFDDSYGKRFVFVFDKSNWYLENVEYFFGELPMYWWKEGEFYYPLNDALKIIESRKPRVRVTIDEFDLKQAFKFRDIELSHISEWHVDKVDESKWVSIDKVVIDDCEGMDLPVEWTY